MNVGPKFYTTSLVCNNRCVFSAYLLYEPVCLVCLSNTFISASPAIHVGDPVPKRHIALSGLSSSRGQVCRLLTDTLRCGSDAPIFREILSQRRFSEYRDERSETFLRNIGTLLVHYYRRLHPIFLLVLVSIRVEQ